MIFKCFESKKRTQLVFSFLQNPEHRISIYKSRLNAARPFLSLYNSINRKRFQKRTAFVTQRTAFSKTDSNS
uniref:Uncharacterized protein n=1 Tax=Leptospira ellisii TaxID=2023197 RepID=A0A2N0B8A9_9LEPT|nr:hypothetical protein CH379_11330 [Leptospira ellisii]